MNYINFPNNFGELEDKLSNYENSKVEDGMDISILRINPNSGLGEWAGAYNPIWVIRKSDAPGMRNSNFTTARSSEEFTLYEIKANKFPIGSVEHMGEFTNHEIQLHRGDSVYLFSDGFADQFGGPQGKKYLSGRFKDTLLELESQPILERQKLLKERFDSWKNGRDQVDDVCVFGIRF